MIEPSPGWQLSELACRRPSWEATVLGQLASAVGKGLFAGAVGTAAMTLSSTAEMRLRGRAASNAPADAAQKVLGVRPVGDRQQKRFATLVHWAYGTGWGAPRGVLAAIGLPAPLATAAHFASIWGAELVMLPALDVAPPVTQWRAEEVLVDALHHTVYVVTAALAYGWLDRD